jgi:hypothetical protein
MHSASDTVARRASADTRPALSLVALPQAELAEAQKTKKGTVRDCVRMELDVKELEGSLNSERELQARLPTPAGGWAPCGRAC